MRGERDQDKKTMRTALSNRERTSPISDGGSAWPKCKKSIQRNRDAATTWS